MTAIGWPTFAAVMVGKRSLRYELFVVIKSLRDAVVLFRKNDPLRMAGATAFFSTFALPPIIFILAQLFGLFIDKQVIGRGLLERISNILGTEGAGQVRQVIRSIRGFSNDWYVIVFGFIFLVFVATTLFAVIKNSLDQIWLIGVKEHPGLLFRLSMRIKSFAVIVAAWFVLLFRFLADGKPSWRASFIGGLVTGILFTAGRLLLRFLLVGSNISHLYGSSASVVLVLLFVFYSSFILYYGACFIKVYSKNKQWSIRLSSKAYDYRIEEIQAMREA